FRFDQSRGFGHKVGAFRGFRKSDNVADAWSAAKNSVKAIEPQRYAPVRGSAVTECFEHVTEAGGDGLRRNLQQFFENCLLQIGLMDTNRSTTKLHAVHDDVVMLTSDLFWVALQELHMLSHRRG